MAALSWPTNACTTASGTPASLSSETAVWAQRMKAQLQSRAFARATEDSKRQASAERNLAQLSLLAAIFIIF
jgi:hypothetical protein